MEAKHNPSLTPLIVGLGNPGEEYRMTYHNAGFLALDTLLPDAHYARAQSRTFSFAAEQGFIFVKPSTYMNESGRAVRDALHYFKKRPEEMAVFHDDADIPLGSYRIQFGKSAAGHHGIESIVRECGTSGFWRVRIGIGKTHFFTGRRVRAERLVLRPISKKDLHVLQEVFQRIKEEFPFADRKD